MKVFQFTGLNGVVYTAKNGAASHMSPTWKWGVLHNDAGHCTLLRTQTAAVQFARYMWGLTANFVLIRYCTKGSKS